MLNLIHFSQVFLTVASVASRLLITSSKHRQYISDWYVKCTSTSTDDKQLFSVFFAVEFFDVPLLHCHQYLYYHAALIVVHNSLKIQRPAKTFFVYITDRCNIQTAAFH